MNEAVHAGMEAVHAGTEAVNAGMEAVHAGTEAVHAGMEAREGEIRSWDHVRNNRPFSDKYTYMYTYRKSVHLKERMEGCIILATFDNIHKR